MDPLSVVLAAVAVLITVYYFAFRGLNYFKKHGIDHVPPTPVFGNMAMFLLRQEPLRDTMRRTYYHNPEAKYVGFYEFNLPIIMLRDIDLIKSVTIKNLESFMDHRPFIQPGMNRLFDNMMAVKNGSEWKISRAQLTPIFTSSKIKGMYLLMNQVGARFADHLTKLPAEQQKQLELKNLMNRYTNDVIANCVLGVNVDTFEDPDNPLYKHGNVASNLNGFVMGIKFMLQRNMSTFAKMIGIKILAKDTENFFERTILDNMKYREENGIRRPDMLQHLLDIQRNPKIEKPFNTVEVISNAFAFYFGGYDSVSSQACMILYHLLAHPECLARLQAEVDEVVENTKGQLTYEAVTDMKYLDAAVCEAMRLYPIAIFMDRLCTKDFELPPALPGGKPFTVKKGTNLWVPIHAIHTDPKHFDNPEQFDPERFLQDGKKLMGSGAYIPFGMGPRMCIGNRFALTEMKVIIFHILARCDLKPCPKTQNPLKLSFNVIGNAAKDGYWFKVEPRKNCSQYVDNLLSSSTSESK
ncbi:cytochrome P450 9e2-like [Halictus rubicundus]|uniref:cytochrome P450 9e2-like n=1 Tax=Halictus rubicundus TaxID=77578 RepID=UPI004036079D